MKDVILWNYADLLKDILACIILPSNVTEHLRFHVANIATGGLHPVG
jgi:hypothetical protein